MLVTAISNSAQGADAAGQDPAGLGDLSMEELMNLKVERVYGASRYEQKVTNAPSAVSIVTADEIRKLGHRTLADVLRSVRGLYVSDDRNYTYLGIRGFLRPNDYNTRVLVLIDGHRVNDNLYDSGTVAREGMVTVDLIDRVEIIRGPSSSIYGSSAFFGVINVITKRGGQLDGMEIAADAGSFDTYNASMSLGGNTEGGLEWLVSASNYDSGGVKRLYVPEFDERITDNPLATNNGMAVGIDGERAFNLFGNASYGDFRLASFFSDRVKRIPTASFGTAFDDGREETTDYRGYVDIQYEHNFCASLNLQGRLFYDNYTYHGAYPYGTPSDTGLQDELLLKDGAVGEWIGTQWQLTANVFKHHTLIVGGEFRDNIREYQVAYYDVAPRDYQLRDDRSSRISGVFAQDEISLSKTLLLTAGLRYDYYLDSFGGTVNPRLGLIYNPTEATTLKVLYGEAYRAPNPYERYSNAVQSTRPQLRPETVNTYELVAEHYLGPRYRLTASAYYYDIRDLISQAATQAGETYFDNLESANATGVELEMQARYDSGLLARASYALQRTEDGQTHHLLSSSPQHLGKLSLIVPLPGEGLSAGLDLQYNSSSRTLSAKRADDFLTVNLTLLSQQVLKNLSLSFSVYNLFDESYGYPGAEDHTQDVIEQDGRTLRGSATYRF